MCYMIMCSPAPIAMVGRAERPGAAWEEGPWSAAPARQAEVLADVGGKLAVEGPAGRLGGWGREGVDGVDGMTVIAPAPPWHTTSAPPLSDSMPPVDALEGV